MTYFPNSTGLSPFSEDHHRMIARLQGCILHGGRTLNIVYRGFAKSTITERAALWAASYGHRRFIPIFSATLPAAKRILRSIKTELQSNPLLYEDFPELCAPVHALEGKSQRSASQTYQGALTQICWTGDQIVLPSIRQGEKFSPGSGAIIASLGLIGASRGMNYTRADGTVQRPDFVLLDDLQTQLSARSPGECSKRLDIIYESILGMAGHRESLAVALAATILQPDDMIEKLLDTDRFPGWEGNRVAMMKKIADAHESLWLGEYKRIRTTYDRELEGDARRARSASNEFYSAHRAEMDAGCEISWESCYDHTSGEISAIQHAYNWLIDKGPSSFASECQNEPLRNRPQDTVTLKAIDICRRLSFVERGTVPSWCDRVTCFVDVQKRMLFWMVAAWSQNFTGTIIDYGTFPNQRRARFTHDDPPVPFEALWPTAGLEGQILAALRCLLEEVPDELAGSPILRDHVPLLPHNWRRQDGADTYIGRCLVDQGYESAVVNQYCGSSRYRAVVMPSKGRKIGPGQKAFTEYKPRPRETLGDHWRLPEPQHREVRFVDVDTNFWKSHLYRRLHIAIGDPGALSLFGGDWQVHELLGQHWTNEFPDTQSSGNTGRAVEIWKALPGDNDYFDCGVGVCVGASMLGCAVEGMKAVRTARSGPRKTLAELKAEAMK